MTKDVVGFEGLYTVNESGNVFSPRTGKRLKPIMMGSKYLYVHLCNGKKTTCKRLHRVVAEAFIPNPNNLPQVNHIDGNKNNCSAENLEWCSPKENTKHAIETGLIKPKGEDNPSAKLTESDVRNIRAEYAKKDKSCSFKELSRKYGVTDVAIRYIVIGKTWKNVS